MGLDCLLRFSVYVANLVLWVVGLHISLGFVVEHGLLGFAVRVVCVA